MDFTEVIKTRRSIRKFSPETIPDDVLKRIFESARLSPTWANKQGVRYVLVDEPELLKKISRATQQKWAKNASLFVVICISAQDSGENLNNLKYFSVDAAICLTHLILAATNEGLGTCWMGWFDESRIQKILGIPEDVRIIGLTPLGYPDYEPREQKRKPTGEILFKNGWKKPFE